MLYFFQNLFKPNFWFYFFHLGHILALEAMAYLVMYWYGTGWIPWTVSLLCYSTVQVSRVGWGRVQIQEVKICVWSHPCGAVEKRDGLILDTPGGEFPINPIPHSYMCVIMDLCGPIVRRNNFRRYGEYITFCSKTT